MFDRTASLYCIASSAIYFGSPESIHVWQVYTCVGGDISMFFLVCRWHPPRIIAQNTSLNQHLHTNLCETHTRHAVVEQVSKDFRLLLMTKQLYVVDVSP